MQSNVLNDAEYQRFMAAMGRSRPKPKQKIKHSEFECQECGHRLTDDQFYGQLDGDEVECPECGSTDLDIALG